MKRFGSRIPIVLASFLAVSAASGASRPITLELKLPAKPAVPRPEMAAPLATGPITLEVTDARGAGDPAVVGAQREKGEDVYVWRAEGPVVPAVERLTAEILKGWSVRVAPEADFGLRLALVSYYVNERSDTFGSTYIADVRFHVAFVDRKGSVLWTGEATGDAKRPGVDRRSSMCNEALSLALRNALGQALSSVKLGATAPVANASPAAPAAPIAIEPDALLADLARLKAGGVAEDVLVAYVEQRRLSRPLTVDEILRWKNAGIPDAAIKAATRP